MGLPVLFVRMTPVITAGLAAASKTVLARIGTRLGMAAASVSPSAILKMVGDNKATFAMVMYELYGASSDFVKQLVADDASVGKAIEAFDVKHDEPKKEHIADMDSLADEYQMISDAVGVVNSLDRLILLKKALGLSPATFMAYRNDLNRMAGKRG